MWNIAPTSCQCFGGRQLLASRDAGQIAFLSLRVSAGPGRQFAPMSHSPLHRPATNGPGAPLVCVHKSPFSRCHSIAGERKGPPNPPASGPWGRTCARRLGRCTCPYTDRVPFTFCPQSPHYPGNVPMCPCFVTIRTFFSSTSAVLLVRVSANYCFGGLHAPWRL